MKINVNMVIWSMSIPKLKERSLAAYVVKYKSRSDTFCSEPIK